VQGAVMGVFGFPEMCFGFPKNGELAVVLKVGRV